MNRPDHEPETSRLDAYLDGLMSDADRASFEAELARNPKWQAMVARQNDINARLTRLYGTTPLGLANADPTAAGAMKADRGLNPGRRSTTALLAAACIALVVLAGWQVRSFFAKPERVDPYAKQSWRDFAAVYQDEVTGDFRPVWKCEDDATFARFVADRFGQPAVLATLPPGTVALGWSYSNTISENTAYLLGTVGEAKVLVFIDRLDRDSERSSARCSGVHVHRRELGDLVLYEVSAMDQPHFVDKFRLP